jgi:ankyrin repeat protein
MGENFGEKLIDAVETGGTQTVQDLLDAGVSINTIKIIDDPLERDCIGLTAIAAKRGDTQMISLLIKGGAKSLDKDKALRFAAKEGHLDSVKLLPKAGADIHDDYEFAAVYAAQKGHTEVLEYLLDKGCDVNNDYLLESAGMSKNPDTLELVLTRSRHLQKNPDLVLCALASIGDTKRMEELIERGASIHHRVEDIIGVANTLGTLVNHSNKGLTQDAKRTGKVIAREVLSKLKYTKNN